ncbi:MAG: hypothetical protein JWR06_1468, partial [Jatrophihabitans sp.]|nr:hypothetical protein [Jatrophihabitans sp.]
MAECFSIELGLGGQASGFGASLFGLRLGGVRALV